MPCSYTISDNNPYNLWLSIPVKIIQVAPGIA
uniref:Uncharacterized protein n=1 Tax=Rhizophora mucronata TaxID=61149 RepID=A0A2P2P640_RHIMU